MRLQKAILTYNGHINDYKHCPSLVDSSGSLLISGIFEQMDQFCSLMSDSRSNLSIYYCFIVVGNDACIRLWGLFSGELARCIEPVECGLRRGCKVLPTICYSETFGGQQFNPSLLVAVNNQIVQFSTHMGQHI